MNREPPLRPRFLLPAAPEDGAQHTAVWVLVPAGHLLRASHTGRCRDGSASASLTLRSLPVGGALNSSQG